MDLGKAMREVSPFIACNNTNEEGALENSCRRIIKNKHSPLIDFEKGHNHGTASRAPFQNETSKFKLS